MEYIITEYTDYNEQEILPLYEKEVTKGDANISTFQPEGADF